jgi:hypothetical protein
MSQLGKLLIIAGVALAALGLLLVFGGRVGLGRLPGDIVWRCKSSTVYFPIVTSVVLSVVLTLLFNVFLRPK